MSKPTRLSGRRCGLERKLAAYAMAGGALVATTAGDASADLITVPIDQTIGASSTQASSSYSVTVDRTTILTFSAAYDASTPAATLSVIEPTGVQIVVNNNFPSANTPAALPVGFTISGSLANSSLPVKLSGDASGGTYTMASYGATSSGTFVGLTNAYLGVSFPDPIKSSQTDYGYVTLGVTGTTGSSPSVSATIESFTYDNTGAAVTIQAVPEPSSLATVAMGAAGIGAYLAWRKRRETA